MIKSCSYYASKLNSSGSMRFFQFLVFIVNLLLFLVSTSSAQIIQSSNPRSLNKLPKERVKYYEEFKKKQLKIFEKRLKSAKIKNLSSKKLPKDSAEIRVWMWRFKRIGPYHAGYVIQKKKDSWKAFYVSPDLAPKLTELTPINGWSNFWNRLVGLEIFTLPDESNLKDKHSVRDGEGYVVELKKNGVYRNYGYNNPKYQSWPEAKKFLKIIKILEASLKPN